ncbi:MAG TPA: ribonuclease HII [Gemmatimonadaceae bacterium]|nr:ribonuclease HII [Gemmatimonadaceae bacterium]
MADRGRGPRRARRWSAVERTLRECHGPLIAGVDEVGRGPLAGPVVACAVVMPPDVRAIRGVDDSKQLTPARRERLAARIRERALAIALGAASVREIERLNIYHATTLAIRRALARLPVSPHHVLLDGKPIRALGTAHTAVVGADARCYSVACASIVAKVTRDRLMRALARRYPGYAWHANVGYATPAHLAGVERAGPSPHHRRTFLHARQLELRLDAETLIQSAALHAVDSARDVAVLIDLVRDTAADVGAPSPGEGGARPAPALPNASGPSATGAAAADAPPAGP